MERNGKTRIVPVACLLVLGLCATGLARTISVDNDGTAEFSSIQPAIDAAVDGDTVIVERGIYTGDGNRDLDFKGKAITVRSVDPNDWATVARTIIDCEGTEDTPHRGFHFHSGEGPESMLDGFTITKGHANDYGGAIFCEGGSGPTISKCIIADNQCGLDFRRWHELIPGYGGGIACLDGSKSIIDHCIISGNQTLGYGHAGGGIYCAGSNVGVMDCWLVGNASGEGGGIYCKGASPRISQCIVEYNRAETGAGIYCSSESGRARVVNCTILGNIAEHSGAGLACGSNVTAAGCLIAHNEVRGQDDDWSLLARDPGGGGGIRLAGDGCLIANCTIGGNTAFSGSGLLAGCVYDRPGQADLYNCIIWGNTGEDRNQIVVSGCCPGCRRSSTPVALRVHSSCIPGVASTPGEVRYSYLTYVEDANCVHLDPHFVDIEQGDFRLRPDSPCIDTGDGASLPVLNDLDVEGRPRVVDGDGDTVTQVDMGAYEASESTVPVIATSPQYLGFHVYVSDPVAPAASLTVSGRGIAAAGAWTIDCNAPWLRVRPKGGITGDVVTVYADGTSMVPGVHCCDLYVHADWAANSPFRVPVQLQIGNTLRVPDAYRTLREAMDVAQAGDLIMLADGLYTGEGNEYVRCSVPGLTIRSENGPENCIIDCNSVSSERRSGIWVLPAGSGLLVQGVTITRATGAPYITGANVTVRDCRLMQSRCRANGALLRVEGCRFDEVNLQADYSDLEIHDSEIARAGTGISGTLSHIRVCGTPIHHSRDGAIRLVGCPEAIFSRCIISGNGYRRYGGFASIENTRSEVYLRNCTVVGNTGLEDTRRSRLMPDPEPGATYVWNSIFWDNRGFDDELLSSFEFAFSNVASIAPLGDVMSVAPLFADSGYWDLNGTPDDLRDDFWVDGDYHLKSQGGRWDSVVGDWVLDDVTSPCIDAGDPNSPVGAEPHPNGARINMGAYGGTVEASKSF